MTPLQLGTKEDTRLHRGVFSTLQKSQKSSIIHVRQGSNYTSGNFRSQFPITTFNTLWLFMNLADALLRWNVNKIDVLLHIIEQKNDTRLFILEKRKRKFYNCKSVYYCKQRLFFTKIIKGQQLGHEHSLITYVHLLMSKQMTMYHRVFLFFLFSVPSVSPRPSAPLFLSFLKNLYIFFSIILSVVGSTFDK